MFLRGYTGAPPTRQWSFPFCHTSSANSGLCGCFFVLFFSQSFPNVHLLFWNKKWFYDSERSPWGLQQWGRWWWFAGTTQSACSKPLPSFLFFSPPLFRRMRWQFSSPVNQRSQQSLEHVFECPICWQFLSTIQSYLTVLISGLVCFWFFFQLCIWWKRNILPTPPSFVKQSSFATTWTSRCCRRVNYCSTWKRKTQIFLYAAVRSGGRCSAGTVIFF